MHDQELILGYFKEISKIPRNSGSERAISNYIAEFAKKMNLEVIQDDNFNLIIRVPATKGYENSPVVILQGHMDMVCEKNKDFAHDFTKEPIQLKIEGDIVLAEGTSLGADNGLAIAYMMAIMTDKTIEHPELEIVLTTEEETTMSGAENIDTSLLKGKILINLDSEEEGILCVSSAGGASVCHRIKILWKKVPLGLSMCKIKISGLTGGHSGDDIIKERGNGIKLLGRILYDFNERYGDSFYISYINGGSQNNAIPREAEAIIHFEEGNLLEALEQIKKWNEIFKEELRETDPEVLVKLSSCNEDEIVEYSFSDETKTKLIMALVTIPNGIVSMNKCIENLVQSSTNIGAVICAENEIVFESLVRSSLKSEMDMILAQMKTLSDLIICEYNVRDFFPEWSYKHDSSIRGIFEKAFKEANGKEIEIQAAHAGLECGFFVNKMPELDAVSYGPNIFNVHTISEHFSLSSANRTWKLIKVVLKNMEY